MPKQMAQKEGRLKKNVFKGGGHSKYYVIDGFDSSTKVLPEFLI